jgi:hypothetical protein
MKRFVRITAIAERVLVAENWLYAGESRVVHRRYANIVAAANPGAIVVSELGDGETTEPQPAVLEEVIPHAHHAPVADRQSDRGAVRKGRRP